jgi:serine/threonine-protein kinase
MAEAFKLGRYSVYAELASGGMATVYLGRVSGAVGFGRTVAIKRLHPHLSRNPEFVSMFLDEARLAARVQHPNVVPTLDVVTESNELFLVLEYVKGETLGGLLRAARHGDIPIPVPVTLAIVVGLLNGLHAAHEAKDEQGAQLHIVHRDVSPHNVIVGADGVARVLDFGVAKAATRLQTTRDGQIKGKISYMAPEQVGGQATRRSDIYSAGVVLWEALTLSRLFVGDNEAQLLHSVIYPKIEPPSHVNASVSPELDRIVLRALAADPAARFATARQMAEALDACMRPASTNQVAEWLESMAGASLHARNDLVAEIESHSGDTGKSEVRKLIELGPAALLAGESGPQMPAKRLSSRPAAFTADGSPGAPEPGSSVTVASASVSITPRGSSASRSWKVVGGGALLVGTLGGVALVVARGDGSGSASSSVIMATVAAPEATTVPRSDPSPPLATPVASDAASAVPSAPGSPPSATVAAHPKKPASSPGDTPGPRVPSSKPKPGPPPAAGNMDSLLDSH